MFTTVITWLAVLVVLEILYTAILRQLTRSTLPNDLDVYVHSVGWLRAHGSLYGYLDPRHLGFTYPPFAGLVLWPLSASHLAIIRPVWTLLTCVAVFFIAGVLASRWCGPRWYRSARFPLIALALTFSLTVLKDLTEGQVSMFLVVAVLVDALNLAPRRLRGVATGVACAIKLTPLVFVAYFWMIGRRRVALVASATFAVCGVVGALVLPGDSRWYWLHGLWDFGRVSDHPWSANNMSVGGVLYRVGLSGGVETVSWLALVVVIGTVGMWRAAQIGRAGDRLLGVSIAGCVSIACLPISWDHHTTWILLSAVGTFAVGRRRGYWPVLVFAMMICLQPAWLGFLRNSQMTGYRIAIDLVPLLCVAICCAVPFREVAGRRPNVPGVWRMLRGIAEPINVGVPAAHGVSTRRRPAHPVPAAREVVAEEAC